MKDILQLRPDFREKNFQTYRFRYMVWHKAAELDFTTGRIDVVNDRSVTTREIINDLKARFPRAEKIEVTILEG